MSVSRVRKRFDRYKRLVFPSAAERKFRSVMGTWFFLRYRIRREYYVGGYYCDFAIPHMRVDIEVDGAAYHQDVVKDYERDRHMNAKGWEVIRIPAGDLWRKPGKVRRRVEWRVFGG